MNNEKILAEIKEYLRVETDEEDTLLSSLFFSAKGLAESRTGKPFKIDKINDDDGLYSLYFIAIKLMVANWYENRNDTVSTTVNEIPNNSKHILRHIALCGDYSRE